MDIHSVSSGEFPTVTNRWMYYTLALMPWLSRDSKSLKACVNLKNIISHHFFFLTHQTDFRQSSKPSVSHKCGHSLFCSLMLADAGKDWRQKKVTEDEMVGWHHQLSGHELGQTLGDGEKQGGLTCCSPWGCKKSDMTWQLNNNNNKHFHNTEYPAYNTQMRATFSKDSWVYFPSYPCCSESLVTDAPRCFLFLLDSGSETSLHLEVFYKSWF